MLAPEAPAACLNSRGATATPCPAMDTTGVDAVPCSVNAWRVIGHVVLRPVFTVVVLVLAMVCTPGLSALRRGPPKWREETAVRSDGKLYRAVRRCQVTNS